MNVSECVVANHLLPAAEFESTWSSIVLDDRIKERMLHAGLLALRLRPELPAEVTALHGLILLYGPPGTGKTTLARGLAQELAPLTGPKRSRLIEVNPHGLMSAEHGQSQQKVYELLAEHVPTLAGDQLPTVVLLDEVESMAVARSAASLEANPADVHRATDAVLTALDEIARNHPHILVIATSNFTDALDVAFKSRADASIEVPLPDASGVQAILERVLMDFGAKFPSMGKLATETDLSSVALTLVGLDGRRIRKLITEALGRRRETIVDPNLLEMGDLIAAANALRASETPTVEASLAAL